MLRMRVTMFGLSSCLAIILSSPLTSAEVSKSAYPPTTSLADVRMVIDAAPKTHPRLLANKQQLAELARQAARTPLNRQIAALVIRQADALIGVAPIERRLQGRRLLGESRTAVRRTLLLSTAFHLTGEHKYVTRCEKEMLAAARFSDWNPSHFLDVAEMTWALALGYDWLYHELDSEARSTIRDAIIHKGVDLPWTTRHKGWVRASNNWGQVCHGGLTAGALAVLEDEPDLAARTVHNALHNVTRAMDAYAPNGSYPEGPGYWSYGTSYNVVLIAVLQSVLATDFGLTKAPGFDHTGQFPELATGPSGLFFNYSDGGARRALQPALFWFAANYDRPDWLWGETPRWQEELKRKPAGDPGGSQDRFLPLVLLWASDSIKSEPPKIPLHWQGEGSVPITIHRSSWTDPNATFVGLKAGSPSANHGQMDTGSFVLDADTVRWAIDLGSEGYHGIESRGMNLWDRSQNSDRWTIFRQNNRGHNTLVIDGQSQRAAGRATIVDFSSGETFPHTVIDMSSVYEGQAKSVRRGVALLGSGEVLIRDELTGLRPGQRVRWGMLTAASVSNRSAADVTLEQGHARLTIRQLAQKPRSWTIVDTSKPVNEWDSPNPGTRMVTVEATVPASGDVQFTFLATPGSCRRSQAQDIPRGNLDSWRD